MTGPQSPPASEIVAAARALVAEEGVRGLSLRKVAGRAGLSLGGVSYHAGAKGDLMRELLGETIARQSARHARWLVRAKALDFSDPAVLATFVCAWLDDAALGARDHAIVACELLLETARVPAAYGEILPLTEGETAFWRAALAGQADGEDLGLAIADYCRDELPFTLALVADPDYRLVRASVAARLAARLRSTRGRGFAAGFEALTQGLRNETLDIVAPLQTDPTSRRARLAAAAGRIIAEDGIAGATHRAVAAAAGAPNSTVAHHFRTRDDLLKAGMQALYLDAARAFASAELGEPREGRTILRATHAMALAAAREPALARFTRDLRRQRGEHVRSAIEQAFGEPHADLAAVQAAAMVMFGRGFALETTGAAEAPGVHTALERLARLRAAR